jgi:hypothetical protein
MTTGGNDSGNANGNDNELLRLAKLVKVMRAAHQKWADGDHSRAVLTQCRDLERRVDRAVQWVLEHRQGELFPENDAAIGPYRRK